MPRASKPNPADEPAPGADFVPEPVLVINSPEMLKAVGDPLRLKILEILSRDTLTVKQVATRLGEPPTKLYYHVSELEALGFLKQVDTRIKSGIVEKYFRLTAEGITVDPLLLNLSEEGESGIGAMLNAIFGATVDDLLRSLKAGLVVIPDTATDSCSNAPLIIGRNRFWVREERIAEFVGKFADLLQELAKEDQLVKEQEQRNDWQPFACTIAFYPQVHRTEDETNP